VILNRVEKALMNNPLRASLQRWYEARLLQRFSARQFLNELDAHRLKVRAAVERVFGDFVLGVAEKVE
jgi:hypothetical protein